MPEAEYHSSPALSSTGVRSLLPEYKGSPAKFQWDKDNRRTSRAFDVGHAAHAKVLGVGAGLVTYPNEHLTPSGNVSTKAATLAWETEMRAGGMVLISPAEKQRVDAMAEAILAHPSAGPLLEVAVLRELSVFSEIDGVPVRARFDAVSEETRRGILAVDVKTTDDATENGFVRTVNKYGYEVQDGHYEDVYEASEGRPVDEFWFIVVEKSGPHGVGVFRLDLPWLAMGKRRAAEARRIFRECTESGVWPGYDPKPRTISAPAYSVIDFEMQYDGGGEVE